MATHKEANSNKKTILLPQIRKRKYYLFTLFNIVTSLLLFVAAVILSSFAAPPQAKGQGLQCTYRAVPCDTIMKGLFFAYPRNMYEPVLQSNMPYEIMQGYIVGDSIAKAIMGIEHAESLLASVGSNSDTLAYALKYIYRMADYDPIRFYSFLNPSICSAKGVPPRLVYGCFMDRIKTSSFARLRKYVDVSYILHIKVNTTDVVDPAGGRACLTKNVAFCTVLDTIKGQKFPCVNNNLYKLKSDSSNINAPSMLNNFAFSYCHQWRRISGNSMYQGIYDSNGGEWIKPNHEYIIFALISSARSDQSACYYSIVPSGGGFSYGMYPVVNGQVIDEDNYLGFGNIVPLQAFKQRMQEQINQIKNYGE